MSLFAALDVSNNTLGPEGIASLSDWLAQPNSLKKLNLANTTPAIDGHFPPSFPSSIHQPTNDYSLFTAIFGALVRGCCQNLTHLDLSNNKFPKKPSGQQTFELFFSSCTSLQVVDFTGSKMPPSFLESLLGKLVANSKWW